MGYKCEKLFKFLRCYNHSNPTETDDVVILTSEPEIEEVHDSPITIVAEEHNPLHNVEVETQFGHEEGDEDLHEDVDFLKEIDFTGISDDLPSSIELNLDDDELGPFPRFDNRCFKKVIEVAQPATKTGEEVNAFKILLSSSKPMKVSSGQRDVISEIPPSGSTVSTSALLLSESTQQQTSQSPLKGSRSDSRLGVPSISQEPPVLPNSTTTTVIATTTTISIPPLQSEEGASIIFDAGVSSSITEYSPT
ncbi:unnamed protein product [Lactuca saligna]|uniref:Uncharacterized protein n=1 Tax=Lactuca saligna TaxID=75948 RepID=A0AA35Y611_LACSI|nr:unnamed protein product [Lactuca saligna]